VTSGAKAPLILRRPLKPAANPPDRKHRGIVEKDVRRLGAQAFNSRNTNLKDEKEKHNG
jgi:hypothetical protein